MRRWRRCAGWSLSRANLTPLMSPMLLSQADATHCVHDGVSCCFSILIASGTQCNNPLNSPPESPVFCLSVHSSSHRSNISSARPPPPPSDPPIESLSVCTGLAHHYEGFVPEALPLWNWRETGQVRPALRRCRFHLILVSCFEMFVRGARCRATATASIATRSCRRTRTLGW